MVSLNTVVLLGHLTREPQLRYSTSGRPLCDLGLAINRRRREEDEVCFLDVQVTGRQAENCKSYLRRGTTVLIHGRLYTHTWTDRHSQEQRQLRVLAEHVQLMASENRRGDDLRPLPVEEPPLAIQLELPPPFPAADPPEAESF